MEDKEYYIIEIIDENYKSIFSFDSTFIPLIGDKLYYKEGDLEATITSREYKIPMKEKDEAMAKVHLRAVIRHY